jgi:MutS-like protein
MIAADWYRSRAAAWTVRRDRDLRTATTLSRWRLVTFLGGVALVWWSLAALRGSAETYGLLGGAAAFAAFAVLVVRHARVLDDMAHAEAALALARQGLARLARDWNALPQIPRPRDLDWDAHPYVRDLDIYGHASVTTWLGATATRDGARRLTDWLLTPASIPDVTERQAAIEELAAKRDWRESLAVQGRLAGADPDDLARFLVWAEDGAAGVPAMLPPLVIGLTLLTWILVAVWFAGANSRLPPLTLETLKVWLLDAITNGWWWLPVVVNITLSFALAGRVQAVFDRAALGQRGLERYAAMLAAVCDETWHAPRLAALQSRLRAGGSAPDLVRALGRLGGWSELRTGAALLHLPIQALTLWDFHVLFALERWRARCGRHVRDWLDALGECDALAVLSIIRADEPSWAVPSIDAALGEVTATAIAHPLMADDRRVANDITVGPRDTLLLITGSNMSGKSTLLRSIGLNLVLAHAGAPVCAASFRTPPVSVYTSIHIEDSLELGLSYFMAALARLKQIVDAAEKSRRPDRTLFYLLDEVLQGTNSIERGLAVRAIARHLLDAGAIGVMTTHDLALAHEEPLKSAARLAHFTEQVHSDGRMTFDYRLRPGLATSTNALRLMQLIGIETK